MPGISLNPRKQRKWPKPTPEERLKHWVHKMKRAYAKMRTCNRIDHWPLRIRIPLPVMKAKEFETQDVVLTAAGDLYLGNAGGTFLGNVS